MLDLIVLKNIYVNFSNRSILHNISLSLSNSNQIVTLIGPNGAGKSTLIRVILGLIKPTSGIVLRSPKISIGYVPQKLYLNNFLPITVERFMELSRRKKTTNIEKILKCVKAESLRYLSLKNLSNGEMQRVLLARALLNDPNFLILDEPVQGVDVMGQLDLYNLINLIRTKLNCTILVVSHDLNFVMAKTEHVICLNKHICCFGAPKAVFKSLEFISIFGLERTKEIAIYHHTHDHIHQY